MEWIIYLIAIFVIILIIFINGAIQERKQYKRLCIFLKESFGKKTDRTYSQTEMQRIAGYHEKMVELGACGDFCLDDITWNDLSMDEIFREINITQSTVGEEYLYHMLRCPSLKEEGRNEWDSLVQFFKENETKRMEIQKLMHRFGKVKKFSLTEILYFMLDLERENNFIHYVVDVLLVLSFCTIFIVPGLGVLFFLTVLAVSVIMYFKRKGEISPYFTTFLYILNMLAAVQKIKKLNYKELSAYTEQLDEIYKSFSKFKKNTYLLSSGTHTILDSPLELLLDYIRMIFHVDIIKFNSMQKMVQEQIGEIEKLRAILGRLDAAVATASYECSLPYYCAPEFTGADETELSITEAFHPLVEDAVANSIQAAGGVLITGSNASGKSTFLKTVAISAVLAQTLGIVPARGYRGPFFRIYSSMALKDSIKSGESYYIVEIKSLKRIVDASEQESPLLCFVDEVLRGTNTIERISASSQILKSLAKPYVLCFAATHDIELTHMLESCYANYHFNEEVLENDVVFSYQLHTGRTETRNAIKLLSIMGYEPEVIKKAEDTAEHFLKTGDWAIQ